MEEIFLKQDSVYVYDYNIESLFEIWIVPNSAQGGLPLDINCNKKSIFFVKGID